MLPKLFAVLLAAQVNQYLVFPAGQSNPSDVFTGSAPVAGVNVPIDSRVQPWVMLKDASGNLVTDPQAYAYTVAGPRLVPVAVPPAPPPPADVPGFFADVINSGLFTADDLVKMLFIQLQKDVPAQNAMIAAWIVTLNPQQVQVVITAAKAHNLPVSIPQ